MYTRHLHVYFSFLSKQFASQKYMPHTNYIKTVTQYNITTLNIQHCRYLVFTLCRDMACASVEICTHIWDASTVYSQ